MKRQDWINYVRGLSTDGVDEMKTQATIQRWVRTYLREADRAIAALESMSPVQTSDEPFTQKVAMLLGRWRQIRDLCGTALQCLSD